MKSVTAGSKLIDTTVKHEPVVGKAVSAPAKSKKAVVHSSDSEESERPPAKAKGK